MLIEHKERKGKGEWDYHVLLTFRRAEKRCLSREAEPFAIFRAGSLRKKENSTSINERAIVASWKRREKGIRSARERRKKKKLTSGSISAQGVRKGGRDALDVVSSGRSKTEDQSSGEERKMQHEGKHAKKGGESHRRKKILLERMERESILRTKKKTIAYRRHRSRRCDRLHPHNEKGKNRSK